MSISEFRWLSRKRNKQKLLTILISIFFVISKWMSISSCYRRLCMSWWSRRQRSFLELLWRYLFPSYFLFFLGFILDQSWKLLFISVSYFLQLAEKLPLIDDLGGESVFSPDYILSEHETTLQHTKAFTQNLTLPTLAYMVNCQVYLFCHLRSALAHKQTCEYFTLKFPFSKLHCSLFIYFFHSACIYPK